MQSSSIHHCVLFLLLFTSTAGAALSPRPVKAKLHQPVDLTCEKECSGVLKWITDKSLKMLAQCNQTSCSSGEGYNISHDHYRKGDLSLTIMEADYNKRTIYACECDSEDICHVRLCIEPLMSTLRLKPGEELILDLPIREPVELIYNSSDSSGSHQICMIVTRLECEDKYAQRVSFQTPNLTLTGLNLSDSGVYIIRDIKNEEVIHVYTLTVEDTPQNQTSSGPTWVIELVVVVLVLVLVVVGLAKLVSKRMFLQRNDVVV